MQRDKVRKVTSCKWCEGDLDETARVVHYDGERYFVCSPLCELELKRELQHLEGE